MKKNFVTFLSPGTFMSETDEQPIDSWDVDEAVRRAGTILQRHGARPYGFYFSRRGRGPDDLDRKQLAKSNLYYLGGRIETLDDVRKRADPKEHILLSNMESNGWDKIVVNDNSYRSTFPLRADDVILDVKLPELQD